MSEVTVTVPLQKIIDHAQDLMITIECITQCQQRLNRALHETIEAAATASGLQTGNRVTTFSGGIDKEP